MLKATFKSMYRIKNGKQMFVYSVSGSAAELAQFEAAQGEHFVKDEVSGAPLYFSNRLLSYDQTAKIDLMITQPTDAYPAGRVAVNETNKTFERAAMLNKETIRQEAKIIARQNLGLSVGEKAEASTPAATAVRQPELIAEGGEGNPFEAEGDANA
jgi:hypothetical protein